MYILLLAWRYLRTRFIAVASILSVTLGVATLIVVNAVMYGFVDQMHSRLHDVLSDVEIRPPGLGEIHDTQWYVEEVRRVVGRDLDAVTTVVQVPAMLSFEVRGQPMSHPITLIGIDDKTFGQVTNFHPYLTNEHNRRELSFDLREDGFDAGIGSAGWPHRREVAEFRRQLEAQFTVPPPRDPGDASTESTDTNNQHAQTLAQDEIFPVLPTVAPGIPESGIDESVNPAKRPADESPAWQHPFVTHQQRRFDASRDQHTGIIIGRAISHRHLPKTETEEARELFLLRPGDDVNVMLPSASHNFSGIAENCTVVDFYWSKMHEYDASFAFMSLSRLQQIRGMVDPYTGDASVSAIQIKLKPGSDLAEVRDRLIAALPPHRFQFIIQTWQDTQRPLLNAVNLELTILNLLLFLIIGVAGFGILATFFMIVVEKTKDIGILKSLGAPGRGVMAIFLGYGLSLGSVGTGAGIVMGLLFVWKINEIADVVQYLTGREIFDPMIYYFSEIPTIVSPWMVLWVGGGAISIAVLASVLPALRAASLHPVEALRYE